MIKSSALLRRLILVAFFTCVSFAKIEISTSVSPDKITVGDSVFFQIDVKLQEDQVANFPELQFENDNVKLLDKILFNNSVKYVFSFWDVGEVTIPEIHIQIVKEGAISREINTKQYKLLITSVLSDSSSNIRAIKDLQDIDLDSDRMILYIAVLILSLILIALIWRKRQETIATIEKYKAPPETAIVRCKRRFDNVKIPFPITLESTEEFYVELSDIFREYIGSIYYVKSLEMTTSEFKTFLKDCNLYEKDLEETYRLLDRADLGKYAKHLPEEEEFSSDKDTFRLLIEKFVQL